MHPLYRLWRHVRPNARFDEIAGDLVQGFMQKHGHAITPPLGVLEPTHDVGNGPFHRHCLQGFQHIVVARLCARLAAFWGRRGRACQTPAIVELGHRRCSQRPQAGQECTQPMDAFLQLRWERVFVELLLQRTERRWKRLLRCVQRRGRGPAADLIAEFASQGGDRIDEVIQHIRGRCKAADAGIPAGQRTEKLC